MNNEQTLELEIKAKAQEAKSSVDTLVKSLTNIENVLTNVYLELGHIEKKSNTTITKNITNVRTLKSAVDSAKSSTDKLNSALLNTFSFVGVKNLALNAIGWMNEAIDYTEQLNLFNVVFNNVEKNGKTMFSELGKEATRFQYKLNETFGTNKNETLYMQGIFQSMGETVGIGSKYSAIMSETMTKLTYDLASLYNKSENKVAEALRAGVYAGQTKPLRSYGIDVTQTSLQPILDSLGIDEQVKNLSQAEKELLRYLATLKQAKIAMGDFANNLESPSNQMKIFKQQLVETKVALTSLFIGTFANIMPYANAFLMTIKEISKAIATMFGIELKDYNTGIASQEGIYDGIEDSANGASKAVKELRRQTLGFDEIHNINENKDNNSGTSVNGGIDQRLLDAIKGYDNGMDKVRMKATEIRDRIMDWLGFTKEIDPLTGKVSFKLKEGYSNLKLIGGVLGVLIGYKLVKNVSNLITGTGTLAKLLGTGGLYKGLKSLIEPIKVLGAKDGLQYIFLNAKSSLTKFLPILGKVSIGMAGLAGVVFGSKGNYNAMKQMTKEANYGGKAYGKYTASVLGTVGGATALGAVLGGPLGAAIGGLTGTIIAGTSALLGYKKGVEELAKDELFGTINVSTTNWKEMLDNLNISINDNTGRYETLKSNLSRLSDTFDSSSNKLEIYGIKFGKLSQKITDEDSVNIKNAIKDMCDSSSSIIDETTTYGLELVSSTFKQGTSITEEEQSNMLKSIMNYGDKQKSELKIAQDNITGTYDNAIKTRGYLTDEEYKYIAEQLQKIRDLTNAEMSKSQTEIEYYKTQFADKNQKIDEQSYSNYKSALDSYHKEKLQSIEETYNQEYNYAKQMLDNHAWTQDEFNKYVKTAYENRNKSVTLLDEELNKYTEKVISNLKEKYRTLLDDNSRLGKEQKKIIEGIFKDLNIDVSKVKEEFKNAGKTCAVDFSNGISNNLKINGNTLYSSWNSTMSKFNNKFNNNNSLGLPNPFNQFRINEFGGVYSNGSWKDIPQYANGGIPSHGSMFIAGENGAEIVGNINRKTEVLNQSQIASAIYSAVYSAMSQFNNGGGVAEINIHADEGIIVETAINGINQRTNQTGVCPVKLPTY